MAGALQQVALLTSIDAFIACSEAFIWVLINSSSVDEVSFSCWKSILLCSPDDLGILHWAKRVTYHLGEGCSPRKLRGAEKTEHQDLITLLIQRGKKQISFSVVNCYPSSKLSTYKEPKLWLLRFVSETLSCWSMQASAVTLVEAKGLVNLAVRSARRALKLLFFLAWGLLRELRRPPVEERCLPSY